MAFDPENILMAGFYCSIVLPMPLADSGSCLELVLGRLHMDLDYKS